MKKLKILVLVIFFVLITLGILIVSKAFNPYLYASPSLREIAEYWSPVIYQSTEGYFDYITNFDFDGNWYGDDNWEHYPCNPLPAYVYYSIIESTDHYIITYNFFHPRDPGNPAVAFHAAHENDFEGCRVVIEKDGSQWGIFRWLETIAHTSKHVYFFDIDFEGSHVVVYVCPYKHPCYGTNLALSQWDCYYLGSNCRVFPSQSGTGIIYRYKGIAEEPSSLNDRDVGYDLINLENTIWERRFGDPLRECESFIKKFMLLSPSGCGGIVEKSNFGARFAGDNYSSGSSPCRAIPPWNWEFDDIGKWFIEPLLVYGNPDGRSWFCAGERYVYNPFRYSSSGCPGECLGTVILAGLKVTKSANKYNIEEGESVTYKYEVYNKGKYPATNIALTDNKLGLIGNKSFLDAHKTWSIQKTVTLNQTTTNQATATSKYYYYCQNHYLTYKSNTVTVNVGDTPPPEPPEPPEPPQEESIPQAVEVWYWDKDNSFTENEHSLANWIAGRTANAHINEDGYLEINVGPFDYPNVISIPDLDTIIPGRSFDAIKILYLNLVESMKWQPEGVLGWLDETLVDNNRNLKTLKEKEKSGEFFVKFPLEGGSKFKWRLILLKKNPNWENEAQTLSLTFSPTYRDPEAQGKFLIWAIKLVKINN